MAWDCPLFERPTLGSVSESRRRISCSATAYQIRIPGYLEEYMDENPTITLISHAHELVERIIEK